MTQSLSPRDMLARLIAFDTTSHLSNREMTDFVTDYLTPLGARIETIPDAEGRKANLLASLGPDGPGGIVLSGHTDVVPVAGQPWDTDPFVLTEKDGKLFGRGTCDMKGFIAIALALLPEFAARGLNVPLHLALSYDEEIGCAGVPSMIARMSAQLRDIRAIIVGEPTSMRVVSANKGIRTFTTRVRGVDAHSSQTHKALSAITVAAELVGALDAIAADELAKADPESPFEPPATTINVGHIEGGTATNIVARDCVFDWECRPLPDGDDDAVMAAFEARSEAILARIRTLYPQADIRTESHVRVPGLKVVEGSPAVSLAMALAGTNDTEAVAYAAEAGLFQIAGFPAVICGPGDVAQAHTANEFVTLEQFQTCEAFLRKLMDVICER